MSLWTTKQIAEILNLSVDADESVSDFQTDSRLVKKGDVFVALKAERDGHDFAPMAAEKGAVALLVECEIEGVDTIQFIVPNVLEALEKIAVAGRKRSKAKRVGITGSCGKTTTKELLALALNAHKPEKSFNNHIGVPLTLARMPMEKEFAVFEIGMNKPGEIAPLSKLVAPDVVIVTTVAPAHIGAFENVDAIAKEKYAICEGLSKDGTLITPRNLYDQYRDLMPQNVVTFDVNDRRADVFAVSVQPTPKGILLQAHVMGELVDVQMQILGEHMVANVLSVLAACKLCGFSLQRAANQLKMAQPMPGRGAISMAGGVMIMDESYNANPASMAAALTTFKSIPVSGKKYAFLAQMNELGSRGAEYHENLQPFVDGLDGVFTVGADMAHLNKLITNSIGHVDDMSEVDAAKLRTLLKDGDAVLIKGSNTYFWKHDFISKLTTQLNTQGVA